jgi:hypothetical protein
MQPSNELHTCSICHDIIKVRDVATHMHKRHIAPAGLVEVRRLAVRIDAPHDHRVPAALWEQEAGWRDFRRNGRLPRRRR